MSDINLWNTANLIQNNKFNHYPTDMMLRAVFSNNYFDIDNIKEGGSARYWYTLCK